MSDIDKKLMNTDDNDSRFNINTKSIITYNDIREIKVSYGILLLRKAINSGGYEILMVKSPISYALIELIYGKYLSYAKPDNVFQIICRLINNITPEEKRLFCTFDFNNIFFYITNKNYNNIIFIDQLKPSEAREYETYINAKNLFIQNILRFKDELIFYINESYNKHVNLWQIPKGKKRENEKALDCAIREMYEETGIQATDYNIHLDITPLCLRTIIVDIEYQCYYYIATLRNNVSPRLKYRSKTTYVEVTDIRWVPINKLEVFISNEYTVKAIKRTAKYIAKQHKRQRYLNSV